MVGFPGAEERRGLDSKGKSKKNGGIPETLRHMLEGCLELVLIAEDGL